ncbi:MAG TPA: hypothetical protein VGN52_20620 [Burkholderiales bacterium]|jgi:hypothetical protein
MATSPATPDQPEESLPPPVYEVQEELVERRISTVPVANDRRGGRDAPPVPEDHKQGK